MEFKVCYFKLKISHEGKGLAGMVFLSRSYRRQRLLLVSEWTRPAGLAGASPPTPKAEFSVYFQNFTVLNDDF